MTKFNLTAGVFSSIEIEISRAWISGEGMSRELGSVTATTFF